MLKKNRLEQDPFAVPAAYYLRLGRREQAKDIAALIRTVSCQFKKFWHTGMYDRTPSAGFQVGEK